MGFISDYLCKLNMQACFNIQKSICVIHHKNKLNKNLMIIPIETEEALDKIQYLLMIKTEQTRSRQELSQLDKKQQHKNYS